jgi:hypothetical protein
MHTEAPKQAIEVFMMIRCLHATEKATIHLTSRAPRIVAPAALNYRTMHTGHLVGGMNACRPLDPIEPDC